MKPLYRTLLGAGLLAACAILLLLGHQLLTRMLAGAFAARPIAPGVASVLASFAVQLLAAVWLLPALRAHASRCGASFALRVVAATALALVSVRALVEAFAGALVVGLPLVGIAVGLALLVQLRLGERRAQRPSLRRLHAVAIREQRTDIRRAAS